jgi:hypothetical protein
MLGHETSQASSRWTRSRATSSSRGRSRRCRAKMKMWWTASDGCGLQVACSLQNCLLYPVPWDHNPRRRYQCLALLQTAQVEALCLASFAQAVLDCRLSALSWPTDAHHVPSLCHIS